MKLLLGFIAVAAVCLTSAAAGQLGPAATKSMRSDDCRRVPGYSQFRSDLERIVAAHDAHAFKALFHPRGAMRVHGIGGPASYSDWNFDRAEAVQVWADLEQILQLGCAPVGQKLFLPKVATLGGDLEPGNLVVMEGVAVRKRPRANGLVVLHVAPGEALTALDYDKPPGWIRVKAHGHSGYVPSQVLRSPHGLRLELKLFEGKWRIAAFSEGV